MTAESVLRSLSRHQQLVVAMAACIGIFLWQQTLLPDPFSYFEWSSVVTNAGPLAFAAMGLTIVFILRGLDMSCGATVALVNVVVVLHATDNIWGQVVLCAAGVAIGAAVGAINGFLIAFLRLQPVVVTLATMFIVMGVNLLLLPVPGGVVPGGIVRVFTGDLIANTIPAAVVVICLGLTAWTLVKRSRFGSALFATGSNEDAAFANGVNTIAVKFFGYVLAGAFYGVAGLFLAAQINTGDPLIGSGMLLRIFTAAVLGGTSIEGGRGGCLGAVFAALTLMLISGMLLTLGVSSDWTSIVEAAILILAIIGSSLGRNSAFSASLSAAAAWTQAIRTQSLPRHHLAAKRVGDRQSTPLLTAARSPRPIPELARGPLFNWMRRNWADLRLLLPPWILMIGVYILITAVVGSSNFSLNYLNALLTLSVFLAGLALGQGAVVMAGGLDLSTPSTLAFAGVLLATMTNGSNVAAIWVVPLVILIGAFIGLCNGLVATLFGIPAIIVTLATNGAVQSLGLLYTGGFAKGRAPDILVAMFNERLFGLAPVVWLLFVFALLATWLLNASAFGRRLVLVGSNARVAFLSGISVGRITVLVYVLSGACAALAGVLLTGFSKVAFLSMGTSFQLPSVAAVLVGGTLATGGRGHYIGILGGCVVLVAVGTLVTGANLPIALRDIVFGIVMLGAVLSVRER
jgi:ribose transport system permease protein